VRRLVLAILLCVAAVPAAFAADRDPGEFTPPGYEFCGWQDFADGGWAMEWSDDLSGAYLVAFADGISCQAARKNIKRVHHRRSGPYRAGYKCQTLTSAHEFLDVRCVKRNGNDKLRYQTGA
jgi:hypothetical protein